MITTTKIEKRRKAKGINQNELARMAGVSQSSLWKIERAGTKAPRIDTLMKIAKALKCDIKDLV